MSKLIERAGVGAMALMLAYALFTVSTATIKGSGAPAPQTSSAAPTAAEALAADVPAAEPSSETASQAVASAEAAPAAQGPDPKAGEKVFAKCKSCHSVEAAKNGVGPSLHGVVNRAVASLADFKYSDGMKAKAQETWTPQLLDQYLSDVKGTVPGTKMSFAGLAKPQDRIDVIAYLAGKSDTPIAPGDLGLGGAAAPATAAADAAAAPEPAAVPAITYTDPPPPSAEDQAKEASAVAALKAIAGKLDYQRARYFALHNKPFIDTATNGECLVCHQEVLDTQVRETSPAGLKTADSLAWYQTLATYDGPQMNFHQRHMTSPYAQSVMNLKCTFCHQGNDVREESPVFTVSEANMTSNNGHEPFTNRKMVNPSETCLRCHGAMPDPVNIMGLPGPWPEARKDLETAEAPNGCLTCHAELFRTSRHKVTYLNAATIEDLATESSDVCFGCHGGRAWYMIAYPYPRHAWPGMDPAAPDWAKDRKTESDPRYAIKDTAQ